MNALYYRNQQRIWELEDQIVLHKKKLEELEKEIDKKNKIIFQNEVTILTKEYLNSFYRYCAHDASKSNSLIYKVSTSK